MLPCMVCRYTRETLTVGKLSHVPVMTFSCFLAFLCLQAFMHAYSSETRHYNICKRVFLWGINAWYALLRVLRQVSCESLHRQAASHEVPCHMTWLDWTMVAE